MSCMTTGRPRLIVKRYRVRTISKQSWKRTRTLSNKSKILILDISECIWIALHTCPEKYFLVIEYPSHANREQIEALIGDTFFGVPWEGRNV